ncbi:hypothetical protein [Teichococcus vastitatis]|jgi:hypothetical protein|uniref:Plasmid stabilization protein n=1 Tax=Teichococcus vastitatis TaxID=2307076 RepID=A0ABS9VZD4_9PROT|nr:hypothetical protein [Pseudoroseomonas vastitatis]MCI0752376.1 hypothetical protein [Pseudoroseomonas vastitatis]
MPHQPQFLLDPVTAHRVRHALAQALRAGCTVREAKGEARGYLRAVRPAMPRNHLANAVDGLLGELDPVLEERVRCDSDDASEPPGQLRLGI